jgi:cell division protein FtsZ
MVSTTDISGVSVDGSRKASELGMVGASDDRARRNETMSIKLELPKMTDLRPRITVVGVGGAGGNAINNMIGAGLSGVDFVAANTDSQALAASSAEHRLQLGVNLTEGLGAGSKPEIGEAAAEEAAEEIRAQLAGTHLLFIAAGMGGGTGTGAASVIARVAREMGVLTVAVVTKPFLFEGSRRMRIAEAGVIELKKHVDTLIVIPNQNLFRIANNKTTFAEAFVLADQVLYSGIACIADLIVKEGLINLDLADVRTVLQGMGTAMMGTGEAEGQNRAIQAAEAAITNPLVDDVTLHGAKGLLLSIIGGASMTLYEVDAAASRVRQEVDPEANIIVGATFDDSLGERIRVSIVASGMSRAGAMANQEPHRSEAVPPPLQQVPPPQPTAARRPVPPPLPGQASAMQRPVQAWEGEPRRPDTAADAYAAAPQWQQPMAPAPQDPLRPAASLSDELERDAAPVWQGPGDVSIEERRPRGQAAMGPQVAPPATNDGESVYGHVAHGFTPEVTAERRRQTRTIPGIDEFPDVGQREFRAKTARGHSAEAPSEADPFHSPQSSAQKPEKSSLLQRLTSAGQGWRRGA